MFVYLQHDREKPIKVEVKDQAKLDQYIKKGSITIKGKDYRILSEEFKTAIEVFYPSSNQQVWDNYNILKDKVKHFKQTGEWLKD
jgi:hypothetical protein